jgi:CheY-like chemotaxis protein
MDRSDASSRTILIVEDRDDIYEARSELLANAGYSVSGVSDGEQAIQAAHRLQPDLILMDLGLPGIDGCEATRRLKDDVHTRHIPIVVSTPILDEEQLHKAHAAGAERVLVTPCPVELLLEIVRRSLAERVVREVLVVDDDDDTRLSIADLLTFEGCTVETAGDGRQALELLRGARPPSLRVILLDLLMPVMDGWQFRAEQLGDPRLASIPVVILSAASGAQEEAASLRANDYLVKPFDTLLLLSTIDRFP